MPSPLGRGRQVDDDDDTFADDVVDTSEEDTEDEFDESDGAPEDDTPGDSERVRALMSMWQKEQARANKLEAELAKTRTGTTGATEPTSTSSGDGETAEHLTFMREMTRDTLYQSDPRLSRYGFDATSIEGATPSQMKASLKNIQSVIDRIEGDTSNRTLKKHGLTPSIKDGGGPADRKQRKSIAEMSDEEIDRLVNKVKAEL